ncbi:MAG TPA: FtsX-like permease family protein [Bryobacteraceae bacterium]|nr:FtsX-like permease family protein [Bryobacteraceae bacterium]
MILLRLISWPDARKHVLRSLLTTAGIMFGIAVFVAMHTANRSVMAAFNQTVDRIAGKTQLQISAGETGFGEDVLERVQSLAEVRIAAPVIEAVVSTGLKGQGNLKVLAVDMTGDGGLRDYQVAGADDTVEDPLVFLAQPDSLIVSRAFADRNGLNIGSALRMSTMDGDKAFTVRGLMRPGGLASAFGGNLAVMDIYAAQKVFGRGRKFDRIDLALRDGVPMEQAQSAILKILGPGFEVEPPSTRGQQFESILRVYALSMNICSVFALLIGMFIIYNSLLIAVTERRKEIGILRALGATREQIQLLFLGESAFAGLVGSACGIILGILIASRLSVYIAGVVEQISGIAETGGAIVIEWKLVLFALAAGILASMLSAVLPARQAASVDPAIALQKGHSPASGEGESRARRIAAAVLAAASLGCLFWGSSGILFYTGYLLIIGVALLLTPTLALWLARLLRGLLSRIWPIEGALAADSVIQSPRRTSSTVAALMLSLAMAIGLAGIARSTYMSIEKWLDAMMSAPLFVSTSESGIAPSFHFPAAMLPELKAVEGIDEVVPVRNIRVNFHGTPVLVVATDLAPFAARTRGREVVAGDYDEMHRLSAAGKGVVVSENFSELQKLGLGGNVELATPAGVLRLPIAGIVKDFAQQQGSIFLDRSLFTRWWKDDSVDVFRVYLKPGASVDSVRRRIQAQFGRERRMLVLSTHEAKNYVLRLADQWFGITYMQIAIAVLVSALGVLNTLTVSITERKRELAVLRAIGGLAEQVRGSVWLEAATVGLIGLVLGLALGAVNLFYQLDLVRRDLTGMPLGYEFPTVIALWLVPIILVATFLAALSPAEYAVRAPLVEALEYE